jgi:hypothetical protein
MRGRVATKETRYSESSAGFSFSAMRSTALPAHQYRDPMALLEAKQQREQRESRRVGETLGKRWSSAREAAEALFDLPPDKAS